MSKSRCSSTSCKDSPRSSSISLCSHLQHRLWLLETILYLCTDNLVKTIEALQALSLQRPKWKESKMTALCTPSDQVWATLWQHNVAVCFANPGTTEMWLVDALNRASLRSVLCLHETVCAGAADGYARLARRPACTLLHLGPGLANALANLHNARRASTPVLNLVGSMAIWHEDADPLLSMDIAAIARTISKTVRTVASASELEQAVRATCTATQTAEQTGGSRVSTLIIPHDLTWPAGVHIDVHTLHSILNRRDCY